jgi:hypothetical protein
MVGKGGLKRKLKTARVECPPTSLTFIVPRCKQESLITETAIRGEIEASNTHLSPSGLDQYAYRICSEAKTMFGILTLVGRPADMIPLIDMGITDQELPLRRRATVANADAKFLVEGKAGKEIPLLEDWEEEKRVKFLECQLEMTAPIFERGKHYNLDDPRANLPFIAAPHVASKGGYGEILKREIHPNHHTFWKCDKLPVSQLSPS